MHFLFQNFDISVIVHNVNVFIWVFYKKLQPAADDETSLKILDEVKVDTNEQSNDPKKVTVPAVLSITPSATKSKIESRVKTVVARDKATGKKVCQRYKSLQ